MEIKLRVLTSLRFSFLIAVLICLAISAGLGAEIVSVDISSYGSISYLPLSPLHTDGRYIKDSLGNIVQLVGTQKDCYNNGDPTGYWVGGRWQVWDPDIVQANLVAMKAMGFNVLRIPTEMDFFIEDTMNFRQNFHTLLAMAEAYGIYVVYNCYSAHGEYPAALPWPPYSTDPDWLNTVDDFISYWVQVATEFESHPNIIYDLVNEPASASSDEYFPLMQRVVDAMRVVTQKIIVIEPNSYQGNLAFLRTYALNGTNIVYSPHIYRYHGHFGTPQRDPNAPYTYDSIRNHIWSNWDWNYTLNTLQLPIWVGETGAAPQWDAPENYPIGWDGDAFDPANEQNPNDYHESEAWRSLLKILNDEGIGYAQWQWQVYPGRNFGLLQSGYPDFLLNEYGMILQGAIAAGAQ